MLLTDGSMPITCAPSRVNGSHNNPAPQPISSMRSPDRQFRLLTLRSNLRHAASRIQLNRSGLILCSGAILPLGSHHSSESFENFATSAGSTVVAPARGAIAGEFSSMAMDDAPYRAVM